MDIEVVPGSYMQKTEITQLFRSRESGWIITDWLFSQISHSLELSIIIIIVIAVTGVHFQEIASIASKNKLKNIIFSRKRKIFEFLVTIHSENMMLY